MKREKKSQKNYHDKEALVRKFEVCYFVLVLRLTKKKTLLNEWQGLIIITKKIIEVIYQVDTGTSEKHYKTFHTNVMKPWASPAPAVFLAEVQEVGDLFNLNKEIKLTALSLVKNTQLTRFKEEYKDVIEDKPGRMCLVHHDISTGCSPPIKFPPYQLSYRAQKFLREEIQTLLKQGIIEPSKSA